MSDPTPKFAQQLRSLREAQGLSVRALANLIGVSKVTVWKWEKGESQPRAKSIGPLARALDVPPSRFRLPAEAMAELARQAPVMEEDAIEATAPVNGEALTDVITRAKRMIAEASGVGPNNITISIEY